MEKREGYKKDRLYYIDLMRIIGMYLIILLHVTSIYLPGNSTAYILNQFTRFGVPLFFIISGVSLYYQYDNFTTNNVLKYYKKRIITIIIPYLLWIIIYFVYEYRHNIMDLFTEEVLRNVFMSLFIGKRHLYFIIIMIQFYIVYPLVCKLVSYNKYDKLVFALSFIITLYLNLTTYLVRWNINITPFASFNYYYLLMPSWIFYFVMGMYIVKYNDKFSQFINKNIALLLCLFVISFLALMTESRLSNTYGSSIKPTVFIYSIISFCVLYYISKFIVKFIPNNIIKWLSAQSFFVFLSHILVMERFKTYLYITEISIDSFILKSIAICILCYIGAYLLKYIPFSNYIGVKR